MADISITKALPAERGGESNSPIEAAETRTQRKANQATHWSAWIALVTLVLTILLLLGSWQERTFKNEWQGAGQEKRVDDHEARLRKLEDVTSGIAVKVDWIYQKLNK